MVQKRGILTYYVTLTGIHDIHCLKKRTSFILKCFKSKNHLILITFGTQNSEEI